jgi:AAA ATPase domain
MHLLERQEQLGILNRCFGEARAASGKLVLITGEAGFGKSSLVEQFVSEIRRDARVLWGACDALDTPRELGPVHEIAAQTPIFDGHTGRADESRDWPFSALFAQLARPEHAAVVVLEDLHWADESTLDFVRFIRTAYSTHECCRQFIPCDSRSGNSRAVTFSVCGFHHSQPRLSASWLVIAAGTLRTCIRLPAAIPFSCAKPSQVRTNAYPRPYATPSSRD